MVTRIAPMDLLIQRMGRLWRHKDTLRPQTCKSARAWILATPEEKGTFVTVTGLGHSFSVTGQIYHPYTLYRTLEALKDRLASSPILALPQVVRGLLDDALESREEQNGVLASFKDEMASIERDQLEKALGMLSVTSHIESSVGTRLITQEMFETLILTDEDLLVLAACQRKEDLVLAIEERLVRSPLKIVEASVESLAKWVRSDLMHWLKRAPRYCSLSICFCRPDGSLTNEDGTPARCEATYGKTMGLCIEA